MPVRSLCFSPDQKSNLLFTVRISTQTTRPPKQQSVRARAKGRRQARWSRRPHEPPLQLRCCMWEGRRRSVAVRVQNARCALFSLSLSCHPVAVGFAEFLARSDLLPFMMPML